jgi:hypothetical protein
LIALFISSARIEAPTFIRKRGCPVSRNAYAIFFYLISRALIVHEILYKEEKGIGYFPYKASAVALVSGFIDLSKGMREPLESKQANPERLLPHGNTERRRASQWAT